ncbi:MAG: hypothetical protein WKF54_08850 [Nocardioidaceae bacterium]
MSEPIQQRSVEQVALESAAGHVSDVLLNLEHTLARAKKAHRLVAKEGVDTNAELALGQAIKDLERVRKRLQQDTYFAGDSLRLL